MADNQANQTKKRILDAAIDVLAEHAISGTRVRIVADEAGVLPSNIHYYYATKEDLLKDVLREIGNRSAVRRQELKRDAGKSLVDQLKVFFNSKRIMIEKDPKADIIQYDFWLQGLTNAKNEMKPEFRDFFGTWERDILEVLSECVPDLEENRKQAVVYIMISMMIGVSMQYHYNDGSMNLEKYFDDCLYMIQDYIAWGREE